MADRIFNKKSMFDKIEDERKAQADAIKERKRTAKRKKLRKEREEAETRRKEREARLKAEREASREKDLGLGPKPPPEPGDVPREVIFKRIAGCNRTRVAEELGLHVTTISKIILGDRNPSLKTAAAMAEVMNLRPNDIMEYSIHMMKLREEEKNGKRSRTGRVSKSGGPKSGRWRPVKRPGPEPTKPKQ